MVRCLAGGQHCGVRVPDDDAARLSRHRQGSLLEQDRGRHGPLLILLGIRAHSGSYTRKGFWVHIFHSKMTDKGNDDAPQTVYYVPICPRGNLLYKQIYLITDQK